MKLNRFIAFVWHLLVSVLIGLSSFAVVYLLWYPPPLWEAQGVKDVFWMLVAVDVTIGPLITLIIFNTKKKSLRFDIVVIATIQLLALAYGMQTLFIARPVVIVFNVDRFDVVSAIDLEQSSLERAQKLGNFALSWTGPMTVAAIWPLDSNKHQELMFSSVQGGPDLPELPEYYIPYEQALSEVVAKALPLSRLKTLNKMTEPEWSKLFASFGKPESELAYLPLRAKAKDGAVIVDRATGAVVKMVLLNPW